MSDLDNPDAYWDRRRLKNTGTRERGEVYIRIAGRRYQVVAPAHDAFKAEVEQWFGVRWRHRSGMWSVPVYHRFKLRALITSCFGADKVPAWMRVDRPRKDPRRYDTP